MKIKEIGKDTYEVRSSELYLHEDRALMEYFENLKIEVELISHGLYSVLIQNNKRFEFKPIDKLIIKNKKIIKVQTIIEIENTLNKGDLNGNKMYKL